jgi:hypothetical protein
MWFASPDATVAQWRQVLVVLLIVHVIVRASYDNEYLHTLWGLIAIVLFWIGADYFVNHPAYVFDVVFILGAAISFAVDALQKIPVEVPSDTRRLVRSTRDKLLAVIQMRRFIYSTPTFLLLYRNAIRDESHVLMVASDKVFV